MKNDLTIRRRVFLKTVLATSAYAAFPWKNTLLGAEAITSDKWGKLLPQRPLGDSGYNVTTLCIGGGHVASDMSDAESEKLIDASIEQGVRFFDTAESYGKGESEERYGRYLCPKYRKEVFLMTKTRATTAKEAEEHLNGSLSRMKTDYLDLWQMHSITTPQDVDNRLKGGVLDFMLEAQQAGKVKTLGFTGHTTTEGMTYMLEKLQELGTPLQACQMPINVVDPQYESFIVNVLPKLVEQKYGVLAMKTLAYGQLLGKQTSWKRNRRGDIKTVVGSEGPVTLPEALGFVWSMPVASLVSGVTTIPILEENCEICRSYPKLDEPQRTAIIEKVADAGGPMMEFYKA